MRACLGLDEVKNRFGFFRRIAADGQWLCI
jgi:hypothetical protein